MKLRITFITIVAAAAALLVFAACESREIVEKKPNALYTVRIGDLDVTGIPEPIEHADWEQEEYEVAFAMYETIVVKEALTQKNPDGSTLVADKVITATANEGARVTWGLAKGGARPTGAFRDTREPVTFELDDYLYIKVTSADIDTNEITSSYYRFSPYMASPVRELSNITIAGRDPTEQAFGTTKLTISDPKDKFADLISTITNFTSQTKGRIDITNAERLDALIEAETKDTAARVRFAYAESVAELRAGNYSEFEEAPAEVKQDPANPDDDTKTITVKHVNRDLKDGNILFVEVTAQDDTTNYYAFQVWVGRMATIARLNFNGVLAAGKGVQNLTWNLVAPGKFASADQTNATGNYAITIELDDPEGDYDWVKLASIGAAAPGSASYGKTTPLDFKNGEALAIRIQSAERDTTDTRYYKVEINLLATNFLAHPKSAVYNVTAHPFATNEQVYVTDTRPVTHDPVTPLTVTLGKQGAFSYQWYEANSWYGGYGFDRDGRIQGDEGYGSDKNDDGSSLTADQKAVIGSGLGFDEKNNVSLHNGGNNYYRLVAPGRKIPGETSASYTPKIDASKRPFIGGYSSQTHYYWVVVTDTVTNLTAISDRAAIVTEWGETWDLGKPTGRNKEAKKHYIVDLHAYMDSTGATVGMQESPKNIEPFTYKREVRRIPITFPDDFVEKDYSVAICQAKFYLADGKEWIQNWTQGDIGFGKEGEQDVIYYNLTNNNATLGLDGDAKEPQGGSLTFVPTHIVVKPAGEKPPKQMPPFHAAGEDNKDVKAWEPLDGFAPQALNRPLPENIDDAQGWFTPYIEIVELRFEGPAR